MGEGEDQRIPVGLSTASVWPQPARAAFELSAELGYDGVEVMVWGDPTSQNPSALRKLSERYEMPILAVHAPCLLITQRVWSSDPEVRLRRSVIMASELGAKTVVVHPPFRWQRSYADSFSDLVEELEEVSGIHIAVENMFPLRPLGSTRGPRVSGYRPSPDPTDVGYRHYTLDLSHTSASDTDAFELVKRMGSGLEHVHLADGTGTSRDEHLVPGTGDQPCAEVCEILATGDFSGAVIVEISTRRASDRRSRAAMLAEALVFARLHLERPTALA